MFKKHPKGLTVLFFANMGERFGYYTMMSIFILFMQAKFGMTTKSMGLIWSGFLTSIYALPILGGILADRIGYGKTVTLGIILMIAGYAMMAFPDSGQAFVYTSLFVIAAGTGLFKGNLVVILGNLYESENYKKMHDAAFNIFYMGINIGAFLSPYAATWIRDRLLTGDGFTYDARIPAAAHLFLQGKLADTTEILALGQQQMGDRFTDLTAFCSAYTASLSKAYHAGFGIAAASIVISLLIFIAFRKYYGHADYIARKQKKGGEKEGVELTPRQVRDRMFALFLVFFVVIFFWMAFHQNGLTLTWIAKDYTAASVGPIIKIFFDLPAFLSVIGCIIGFVCLIFLILKRYSRLYNTIGVCLIPIGASIVMWRYSTFQDTNAIAPELFQSFNPIFVVFLTPVILGFFAFLAGRGKEPSSPRKIGIGMVITAAAYVVLILGCRGLASPASLTSSGGVSPMLITPYWLISMYFSLTVAELFLSPMGLSFVAKVSPPKFRGMMQGFWLGATAVGNAASGFVAFPYANLELWQTFLILVGTSLLSAAFMFAMMKKLDRAISS